MLIKIQDNVVKIAIYSCIQFIVITFIAMFFYPGSTYTDTTTTGYSFFHNFFSDLGTTETYAGQANTVSAILFFIALATCGLGLSIFFVVLPQLFTQTRSSQIVSILGSIFGVITGLSFVGVAFTPANLYLDAHVLFVYFAFSAFLIVSIFYTIAIFLNRTYPNQYAAVFMAFAILLAAYLWLLFGGTSADDVILIQATGQKIIVYAAIISMLIQALGVSQVKKQRTTT